MTPKPRILKANADPLRCDLGSMKQNQNYIVQLVGVIAGLTFVLGIASSIWISPEEVIAVLPIPSQSPQAHVRDLHVEYQCQNETAPPCSGYILPPAGRRLHVERICKPGLVMQECECIVKGPGVILSRAELPPNVCACTFKRTDPNFDTKWNIPLLCVKPQRKGES